MEILDPSQIEQSKRVKFFSDLALSSIKAMRIHRESGQTQRFKDPKVEGGKKERWGDVTQHCLVEAAASQVLSKLLKLTPEQADIFKQAALVHDAGKRPEIEAINLAKSKEGATGKSIDIANNRAYDKSKRTLRGWEVSEGAIHLTETVAHTSIDQFVYLDDENVMHLHDNVPVLDMAMHYLDDITRGTEIVNFDERMDYLDSVAAERYPYNEEGRALWGGRTYFEAQRESGHLIEARLAEIAGIADPKTLPDIINAGLVEMITTH